MYSVTCASTTFYITKVLSYRHPIMAAEVPKECLIKSGLKDELLKEHSLKPTEASEKNILPSAEDLKQEKTHQNMLTGKMKLYSKIFLTRLYPQVLLNSRLNP